MIEASRHAHAAAERELRAGHWQEGVTWLGRALRYHPQNGPAAAHLWSVIAYGQGDRDEPPLEVWAFDAAVDAMAASPDGRWMAVVTTNGRLTVVDLTDGRRRSAQLPAQRTVRALRFDPHGTSLFVSLWPTDLHVASWTVERDNVQVEPLGGYFDAQFTADGQRLLLAGPIHGLETLDRASRKHVGAPGPIRKHIGGLFTPDGLHALTQEAPEELPDGSVGPPRPLSIEDLATGVRREVVHAPAGAPLFFARASSKGAYLAHIGGGQIGVWTLPALEPVLAPPPGTASWPAFAFSPDARTLVVNGTGGALEVRSLPDGRLLSPLIRHATTESLALRATFSGDGRRVLSGAADGRVAAWPRPGSASAGPRPLAPGPVTGMRWLTAARALLARKTSIEVWDVDERKVVGTLPTGELPGGFAVAADGSWIATGGDGGRVRVWQPDTLRSSVELGALPLRTYSLTAGPGPFLIVGGYDFSNGNLVQRVLVLDVVAGGHAGPDVALPELSHLQGLSADGKRLLCCSGVRRTWRAWTVAEGWQLDSVSSDDIAAVEAANVRPGVGLLSITSSGPGGGRAILDVATGLPQTEPFESPGLPLEWSPDGRRVLAADGQGGVSTYETPLPRTPGSWLDDLVAAASGLTVGETGLLRPLTVDERQAARARLAAASIDDPTWARLVRWWLRPPAERVGGP